MQMYILSGVSWLLIFVVSAVVGVIFSTGVGLFFFGACFSFFVICSIAVLMESSDEDGWAYRFLTWSSTKKPERINLCHISGMISESVLYFLGETFAIIWCMTIINLITLLLFAEKMKMNYKPYSYQEVSFKLEEVSSFRIGKKKRPPIFFITALAFFVGVILAGVKLVGYSAQSEVVPVSGYSWVGVVFFTLIAVVLFFRKKILWREIWDALCEVVYAFHENVCYSKEFQKKSE
ncbi:hypothetical protein ACFL2R_00920 [Patescibacteria group bacterium]